MSDIAEIVKEEKKIIKSFPIVLVTNIKRNKGREIFLNELEDDLYYLKIEKTPTFRIKYISALTKEEIANELLYHKELNPCNTPRVCVVPIRRNK